MPTGWLDQMPWILTPIQKYPTLPQTLLCANLQAWRPGLGNNVDWGLRFAVGQQCGHFDLDRRHAEQPLAILMGLMNDWPMCSSPVGY